MFPGNMVPSWWKMTKETNRVHIQLGLNIMAPSCNGKSNPLSHPSYPFVYDVLWGIDRLVKRVPLCYDGPHFNFEHWPCWERWPRQSNRRRQGINQIFHYRNHIDFPSHYLQMFPQTLYQEDEISLLTQRIHILSQSFLPLYCTFVQWGPLNRIEWCPGLPFSIGLKIEYSRRQ